MDLFTRRSRWRGLSGQNPAQARPFSTQGGWLPLLSRVSQTVLPVGMPLLKRLKISVFLGGNPPVVTCADRVKHPFVPAFGLIPFFARVPSCLAGWVRFKDLSPGEQGAAAAGKIDVLNGCFFFQAVRGCDAGGKSQRDPNRLHANTRHRVPLRFWP